MKTSPFRIELELPGLAPDDLALSALSIAERAWTHTASLRRERDELRTSLATLSARLEKYRRQELRLRHRVLLRKFGPVPDRLSSRVYIPAGVRQRYLDRAPGCLSDAVMQRCLDRLKSSIRQHHPMAGPRGPLP